MKTSKIPFLVSYVSGTKSHFDPVVGDYSIDIYTDFLVYATSLTDMYKRMKKQKNNTASAISSNDVLCRVIVEYDKILGIQKGYEPCGRKAICKATYIKGTTGKEESKFVCGIHKKQLESSALRLKRKIDWDMKLRIEPHSAH